MKIIYLYSLRFTQRDYKRYGAEYLQAKGYEVEIWTVRDGLMQDSGLNVNAGMYQGDNAFSIPLKEFEKKVKENRDALFILFMYNSVVNMYAMAKYRCDYFVMTGMSNCLFKSTVTSRNLPKDTIKDQLRRKRQQIEMHMAERYFGGHMPKYVFLGMEKKDRFLSKLPNDKKVYLHTFDYDRYLEIRDSVQVKEKYILYVDSGYGNLFTDKLILENVYDPWFESKENVWNKIQIIFSKLEEYYHLPVVVAGHPHTIYPNDSLCGRKVIYNKTQELVANAKFVIMQWSAAISFAVLFNKPILSLIDNNFKKGSGWKTFCLPNYKYFKIVPCNMDVPEMFDAPWRFVYEIDEKIAQKYIDTYIKVPGTPDKLVIEVVEEKIREVAKRRRSKRRNRTKA